MTFIASGTYTWVRLFDEHVGTVGSETDNEKGCGGVHQFTTGDHGVHLALKAGDSRPKTAILMKPQQKDTCEVREY